MDKISKRCAEHYTWGGKCDGWHLAKTAKLSVIEEMVPPGCTEARHHHDKAEQFFYVLSGQASMMLEDETLSLIPGEGIHIPSGMKHRFCNEGDEELVFLVVSTPPSHGDRVEG